MAGVVEGSSNGGGRPLTVGELRGLLEGYDDDLVVVVPGGFIGHGYSAVKSGGEWDCVYVDRVVAVPSSQWTDFESADAEGPIKWGGGDLEAVVEALVIDG